MHINCHVPREQKRHKSAGAGGAQGVVGYVAMWQRGVDKGGVLRGSWIHGHVPSIFILIFAPGIGILGAMACVGRQLVVMYFGFSISARFPHFHVFFWFFLPFYCVLWVHNKLSRNCISEINSFMYVNRLLQRRSSVPIQ